LDAAFESTAGRLLRDPWAARDAYVAVLLGELSEDELIDTQAVRPLGWADRMVVAQLLKSQAYGQRMHTSCGLYWEDLDRLEMRNSLAYAGKAIACVEAAADVLLGPEFSRRLADARSIRNGASGDLIYSELAA
jgi:hypothetical protein